jgi:N-acetylglucosaminyldiphosphoundecaprenol N-acetyl-beta-D-mannosaminyltransferase
LLKRHSNLRVVGARSGGRVRRDQAGNLGINDDDMAAIQSAQPDLLFVAFGHGRQEGWIAQNLPRLPSVAVAMGVGGTFDFIAGRAKRAPIIFRQIGLEWLWRLFREPRRWRRIIDAVIVFPYLVIRSRG